MKTIKKSSESNDAVELKTTSFLPSDEYRHIYNNHVICVTDSRGYAQPDNRFPTELRVDASQGFIPLWNKGVSLNWRFNKSFSYYFKKPALAKDYIRKLMGEAIIAWGEGCPIKFHEVRDNWDFEIQMHKEDCDNTGCVLASSFFPGGGQNTLYIYPTMFKQSRKEQKETIEHEMGHVFGLLHFFANISEKQWKSELFGSNSPFTIMNYGPKSRLTARDVKDLKKLYQLVWSGALTEINGTPIKTFDSYHMNRYSVLV